MEDGSKIHYGSNSGFQAINLAMLMGAKTVLLVGFDFHGSHFFGTHPAELGNPVFADFLPEFNYAAENLPPEYSIINCTEGSHLGCFPFGRLDDFIN